MPRWMSFISQSFILIYCNQSALSVMAWDSVVSSRGGRALWGYQRPVASHMCHYITPITENMELTGFFSVYSQLMYSQKEEKVVLYHQCFINSPLWIFQQLRSSSNASQVILAEACCWALGGLTCTPSLLSRASNSLPPLFFCTHTVHFLWFLPVSYSIIFSTCLGSSLFCYFFVNFC